MTNQPHARYYARAVDRDLVSSLLAEYIEGSPIMARLAVASIRDPMYYWRYADERAVREVNIPIYFAAYPHEAARDVGENYIEDVLNMEPIGVARALITKNMPGSLGLPHEPRVLAVDDVYVQRGHRGMGAFPALCHAMRGYGIAQDCKYMYAKVLSHKLRPVMRKYGLQQSPIMHAKLAELRLPKVPTEIGDEYVAPVKLKHGEMGSRKYRVD